MMPSRVLRVTGEQLKEFFSQDMETMKLRALIAEHILLQFRSRYLDLHCTSPRERYDLLLQRCPAPNYLSTIRKDITFEAKK